MEEHPSLRRNCVCYNPRQFGRFLFNDSGVVAGGTASIYAAGLCVKLSPGAAGKKGGRIETPPQASFPFCQKAEDMVLYTLSPVWYYIP